MIVALSAGRDSPLELRDRLAYDEKREQEILRGPRPGVAEVVLLCTCHRTEVYATGDGLESDIVHSVAALLPGLVAADQHELKFLQGTEAVEHLFRVASGLDSLVVGEPQVLGQVRRAFNLSEQESAAGPVLANIFGRALRVGRRVRAETALGKLGASVGTITAEHLTGRFSGLRGRSAAIVGAGEAATDAARSLRAAGAKISVLGRTPATAARLASDVGGTAFTLEEMGSVFERSDCAVVAVSGGGVTVSSAVLPARTPESPFVVIDLSVPRSVEATGRADVELRSLEEMPGPRGPQVTAAIIEAETLVRKEVADLERWAETRSAGRVIRSLRSHVEGLVREEVGKTLAGMELSESEAEKVAALAMRVAGKLLHGPSVALREADEETAKTIRQMFGLEP